MLTLRCGVRLPLPSRQYSHHDCVDMCVNICRTRSCSRGACGQAPSSSRSLVFRQFFFVACHLCAELFRLLTEKQHERMRTDDRCSVVYFVSRLRQSCTSQVLSVSQCEKEVCNMHAHALRKGTGGLRSLLPVSSARCPFCPSYSLRSSPTGLGSPTGSRVKQLSRTKKSVTPPWTEVAPSLSPNTRHWKTLRIC